MYQANFTASFISRLSRPPTRNGGSPAHQSSKETKEKDGARCDNGDNDCDLVRVECVGLEYERVKNVIGMFLSITS